jgi:hypothetical protein
MKKKLYCCCNFPNYKEWKWYAKAALYGSPHEYVFNKDPAEDYCEKCQEYYFTFKNTHKYGMREARRDSKC